MKSAEMIIMMARRKMIRVKMTTIARTTVMYRLHPPYVCLS